MIGMNLVSHRGYYPNKETADTEGRNEPYGLMLKRNYQDTKLPYDGIL